MSDSAHLLIPFASSPAPECQEALRALALPRLERLLARLAPGAVDSGAATSLSPPHERVLARACGLAPADGRIPWAAWQAQQGGLGPGADAWAQITPCHWRVGSDHVAMDDPAALQLHEDESRALLAAVRPFFEEDGIAIDYSAPTLWLARGETFRDFPAASLERVIGRTVDAWLPRVAGAGPVRRLQQEVQMLLYTHAVNDDRQGRGLLPVNSFWVSGTGALPRGATPLPPGLRVAHALREPALAGDWPAWAAAWREVDARDGEALLQSLAAGQAVTLTLAGERHAHSWAGAGSWSRRLGSLFGGGRAAAALEAL